MNGRAVMRWLEEALVEARANRHGVVSMHVDEIAGYAVESPRDASWLLREATWELRRRRADGCVRLAVPLATSEELDPVVPDSLGWPPARDEPPSVYYFEPSHWLLPLGREEYRCPWVSAELAALELEAEYVCGRSRLEREQGWDFSRTLWLSSSTRVGDAS